jgi:hypothetical protein
MKLNPPDRYDIEARYVPALVCSVPFVYLGRHYLSSTDATFWNSVIALNVGSLGLTTALFLVSVYFSRALSKILEVIVFDSGKNFPTTKYLLDEDDHLSSDKKAKIISKIRKEFGVDLRGHTSGSESDRLVINEAVTHVRRSLYKKSNRHLERNIQYGLTRNLLGASLIATAASLLLLVPCLLVNDPTTLLIASMLGITYSMVVLLSLGLIRFMANQYALTMFDEYLAL